MDPNQPNQPADPQYPPNQAPGYQQPGYPPPGSQQPGYVPPPPPGPYSQPMGQQPYNQYGAPPPPQQPAAARWGPTSLGMDANLAAGLGYLIPIVGLIFFLVEKTNRYVRFNGAQATLIGIGYIVLTFLSTFGSIFTAALDRAGVGFFGLFFCCIAALLWLGLVGLQIWGIIIGFTGQYVKFPLIGQIAEQWAGGPPVAAY
jgi:uncharacterized membrane protein